MGIVSNAVPGNLGLVLDMEPAELPAGAWSDVENMRFEFGAVKSFNGDLEIASNAEQFEWALPATDSAGSGAVWALTSNTKIFALKAQALTDISPTGVTILTGDGMNWSGCSLGGVSVMNNAMQKPFAWFGNNPAVKAVELANWPANTVASVIRSYKQYLVALNVVKSSTPYPTLVKWSHPADIGTVPVSWDEADPTRDAGEYPLSETPGACVDCVPMKDLNVIYKTDSVWGMQWVGGVYIFRFYKMFGDFGMPKKDCAVEYAAGKHFVFTGTDAVIHDGTQMKSVASGRIKSLFKLISSAQLKTCYVASHQAANEVWVCYRQADDGADGADTALVFNTVDSTWSRRVLQDVRYITGGALEPQEAAATTWASTTRTWSSVGVLWAEFASVPASRRLLGLGTGKVYWMDGSEVQPLTGYVERTYLGVPMKTGQAPDLSCRKFISKIWPRVKGPAGMQIRFTFGTVNAVDKAVTWKTPVDYTIGTTEKITRTLNGKMFALRIEPTPGGTISGKWSYHGLDMDIQMVSEE